MFLSCHTRTHKLCMWQVVLEKGFYIIKKTPDFFVSVFPLVIHVEAVGLCSGGLDMSLEALESGKLFSFFVLLNKL